MTSVLVCDLVLGYFISIREHLSSVIRISGKTLYFTPRTSPKIGALILFAASGPV